MHLAFSAALFLFPVRPLPASLLPVAVVNLLHTYGFAGVNHVFRESAAFHVQRVDANVYTRNALGLQRGNRNGENLGADRERVSLARGEHILDAAIDVNVHILVEGEGGRDGKRIRRRPRQGRKLKRHEEVCNVIQELNLRRPGKVMGYGEGM